MMSSRTALLFSGVGTLLMVLGMANADTPGNGIAAGCVGGLTVLLVVAVAIATDGRW